MSRRQRRTLTEHEQLSLEHEYALVCGCPFELDRVEQGAVRPRGSLVGSEHGEQVTRTRRDRSLMRDLSTQLESLHEVKAVSGAGREGAGGEGEHEGRGERGGAGRALTLSGVAVSAAGGCSCECADRPLTAMADPHLSLDTATDLDNSDTHSPFTTPSLTHTTINLPLPHPRTFPPPHSLTSVSRPTPPGRSDSVLLRISTAFASHGITCVRAEQKCTT